MKNKSSLKKCLITTSLLVLIFVMNLQSQHISPSVISNGGSNQATSFTVGEPFVTTIGTNDMITQGFHQNYIISTALVNLSQLEVLIYPNPFANEIKIETEEINSDLQLIVYDQNGRIVKTQNLAGHKASIDLSHLISGMYYAVIFEENKRIYSSKLIKK